MKIKTHRNKQGDIKRFLSATKLHIYSSVVEARIVININKNDKKSDDQTNIE